MVSVRTRVALFWLVIAAAGAPAVGRAAPADELNDAQEESAAQRLLKGAERSLRSGHVTGAVKILCQILERFPRASSYDRARQILSQQGYGLRTQVVLEDRSKGNLGKFEVEPAHLAERVEDRTIPPHVTGCIIMPLDAHEPAKQGIGGMRCSVAGRIGHSTTIDIRQRG